MTATNAYQFRVWDTANNLTSAMRDMLMNGYYDEGSATIIALPTNRTAQALKRRGLVHDDHRWTAFGRDVARLVRGAGVGEPGAVKTLDELHALAIAEDALRAARAVMSGR